MSIGSMVKDSVFEMAENSTTNCHFSSGLLVEQLGKDSIQPLRDAATTIPKQST
jgi:hypothetical protein